MSDMHMTVEMIDGEAQKMVKIGTRVRPHPDYSTIEVPIRVKFLRVTKGKDGKAEPQMATVQRPVVIRGHAAGHEVVQVQAHRLGFRTITFQEKVADSGIPYTRFDEIEAAVVDKLKEYFGNVLDIREVTNFTEAAYDSAKPGPKGKHSVQEVLKSRTNGWHMQESVSSEYTPFVNKVSEEAKLRSAKTVTSEEVERRRWDFRTDEKSSNFVEQEEVEAY